MNRDGAESVVSEQMGPVPAQVADAGAVSFDLFGTLVAVERPDDPATRIAAELRAREVAVPNDWSSLYSEPHLGIPAGAECSLVDHVAAALAAGNVSGHREAVEAAVRAAFETDIETRAGAVRTVEQVGEETPIGILSNCAVPGLAEHAIDESGIERASLDTIVTSVGCGWRKPDERAFAAVAATLDTSLEELCHVGDDPATDGGIETAGGTFLRVGDGQLESWGQSWD